MSDHNPDPESFLPLKTSTYRVLLALADETMHGYAIMQALEALTDGKETILPGTLYAALARMENEGLLERVPAPAEEASGGPKRRYHRRTELGKAVARAESARLRGLLDVARAQNIFGVESE